MTNIFETTKEIQKKLNVKMKSERNMTEEILEIFRIAEEKYGKTELTVDEITIAYYNKISRVRSFPKYPKLF